MAAPPLGERLSCRGRPDDECRGGRGGFTLVELLVVIGIIALLMGILMPTLSTMRKVAAQTKSMSNLRQLTLGYTQYHIEHKGAVPFGYPPSSVGGSPVTATLPNGTVVGFPTASRYPWRLMPYVSNVWSMIHNHREAPPVPEGTDSAVVASAKAYEMSLSPTYGLNAYYVGGHTGFKGFDPFTGRPNFSGPAVFRASDVRDAASLIVLSDVTAAGIPGVAADEGFYVVTPPRMGGVMWTVQNRKCVPAAAGVGVGLPQGRYDRGAAVSFFDGHVETLTPDFLLDMRLWSPRARTPDWDYTP